VKTLHQLVEGRRVAVTGTTRKLELCSPIVRIRSRGRRMVGLDAARSSPSADKYGRRPRIISWAGREGGDRGSSQRDRYRDRHPRTGSRPPAGRRHMPPPPPPQSRHSYATMLTR
jgi:hypothetical protein